MFIVYLFVEMIEAGKNIWKMIEKIFEWMAEIQKSQKIEKQSKTAEKNTKNLKNNWKTIAMDWKNRKKGKKSTKMVLNGENFFFKREPEDKPCKNFRKIKFKNKLKFFAAFRHRFPFEKSSSFDLFACFVVFSLFFENFELFWLFFYVFFLNFCVFFPFFRSSGFFLVFFLNFSFFPLFFHS